ncbi:carbohydrate-binding module family 13 protein [Rhizophagus irregularis DAOM 181602=DAOM 197198]|nr:carbohydrate-binding module family 13 protein [Rhizophagus irregularis DAOM 181602=DAOM 197198]
MDDNKLLPKLSQNLLEILNDEEYYDITIEVGNDPYKNDGTLVHIKLPNISPEIFQIILRYIYDLLKAFLSLSDPNSKPVDKSEYTFSSLPVLDDESEHILGLSEYENMRTIDSKIITYQHIELISKWIDRLEITDKLASSYKFKLLFRASRDGHSRGKFHEICDNKPRTVTCVKVKDSNEILGGNNKIDNYILSRVTNGNYATINNPSYGPSFGGSDLIIWGCIGCYSAKRHYEKSIRTENVFGVEECEVFQIA